MKLAYLFFIALCFPFAVNASVVINEVAWPRRLHSIACRGKMGLLFLLLFFVPVLAHGQVIINEVAWMGTEANTADEWMELKNTGANSVDISGWTLVAEDGTPSVTFADNCAYTSIPAGGFFLLERTDDESVPGILADCIYVGALVNGGEILTLRDSLNSIVNSIDASAGWPAGDSVTKQTMQKSGSGWITATGTPRAENAGAPEEEDADEEEPEEENDPNEEEGTEEETKKEVKQPGLIDIKKFRADAGGDTVAIVGVEKLFEGRGYDLDGDPLLSADFLWTFGDGASARGMNARHTFLYPGEYRVVFNVSSGIYNASDAIQVSVIPPPLFITEIKPGTEGFIELHNNSDHEIDISGWGVGNADFIYYFPNATRILPRSRLVVSYAVSHIEFYSFGEAVLYYPDGRVVGAIPYGGITKNDESFHVMNGVSQLGIASPGSERFVARVYHGVSGTVNVFAASSDEETDEREIALLDIVEEQEGGGEELTASVATGAHFYQRSWFWFISIFVFGLISAFAVFAQKRYSS